jgi:hypothetical protein
VASKGVCLEGEGGGSFLYLLLLSNSSSLLNTHIHSLLNKQIKQKRGFIESEKGREVKGHRSIHHLSGKKKKKKKKKNKTNPYIHKK